MAFPEFLCFVGLVAGVFFGIGLARSFFGIHPAIGGVIGGALGLVVALIVVWLGKRCFRLLDRRNDKH